MALPIVYDILSRGKLPIFCGGTGLYLDAVLNGGSYTDESAADTKPDETLRASLLADAERYGAEDLWKRLSAVDPESAAAIHPNNIKKGSRAPSRSTSRPAERKPRMTGYQRERTKPRFSYALLMPSRPRDELYSRIDLRVDMMFADGLGDEIKLSARRGKARARHDGFPGNRLQGGSRRARRRSPAGVRLGRDKARFPPVR